MTEGGVGKTTDLFRIIGIDEIVQELLLQVEQLGKREIWLLRRSNDRRGFCRIGDTPTSDIMVGMLI